MPTIFVLARGPVAVNGTWTAWADAHAMAALAAAVEGWGFVGFEGIINVKPYGAGLATVKAPMLDEIAIVVLDGILVLLSNFVVAGLNIHLGGILVVVPALVVLVRLL